MAFSASLKEIKWVDAFSACWQLPTITVPKRSKIAYTAAPVWKALKQNTESPPPTPCCHSLYLCFWFWYTSPYHRTYRYRYPTWTARSSAILPCRPTDLHLPSERHISYGRTSQASNGELNDKRFLESLGRLLVHRCETHKACVALASCKVVHKHVVR